MTLRVTRIYVAVLSAPNPLETGKVASALALSHAAAAAYVHVAAAISTLALTSASSETQTTGVKLGDSADTLSLSSLAD
jgi:hypothetical protein